MSAFVHASLVAGVALAAIPVIIHLIMRQTPKHIVFPALRLIRERQKRSRKRLKIRNWLLLAARMALIALMALALARPRLYSQTTLGDREVPTALAFVFDTSLSMEYKEKEKTRLREAQDRALEILKKTHESSRVFVIDSAEAILPMAMSPAAARKRIESLTIRPVNRPLNGAIGLAYRAIAPLDLPRHEVYVLTDLARSAWTLDQPVEGLEALKNVKGGIATYILRLSPKDLRDVAVVEAEPSSAIVAQDEPVAIKGRVRSIGPAAKRVVELWIDGRKKDQKLIAIPANGEVEIPEFHTAKLSPGFHQGEIRLGGEPDPLERDDRRYFTLDVQPALKVLLVADQDREARFVHNALEPAALRPGDPHPYRVERITPSALALRPPDFLKDFASVFLLNVPSLPDAEWNRLSLYVHQGGGLVVALGNRIDRANYNSAIAAKLLPAVPAQEKPKWGEIAFVVADAAHPILSRFPKEIAENLASVLVYRHAVVTPATGTRTILEYQNKAPALLERAFAGPKTGRVLLWTTPLSRKPVLNALEDPEAWNEFPADGERFWSFIEIMDRTVPYLAGVADRQLNYEAGSHVSLPLDPNNRFTTFTVQGPDPKQTDRLTEPGTKETLEIEPPAQLGQWTVTASRPDGLSKVYGFSVNAPQAELLLSPLEPRELEALFGGKDRYQLADTPEALKQVVQTARVGHEVFPWMMLLILALVTAENYLANRFYRERPAASGQAVVA